MDSTDATGVSTLYWKTRNKGRTDTCAVDVSAHGFGYEFGSLSDSVTVTWTANS